MPDAPDPSPSPPPVRLAAAYIRCSTDEQEDSPDTQRGILEEYAARHGLSVPPDLWFIDVDVSARRVPFHHRPQGKALLLLALTKPAPFGQILTVRGDRVFRDVEDQLGAMRLLRKAGVAFTGIKAPMSQDTAQERFMTVVMAGAAQYESEVMGERIRERQHRRFVLGLYRGGATPTGFRVDGADPDAPLRIVAAEMALVVLCFEAFAEAGGVAERAAILLNARAVPPPWTGRSRPDKGVRPGGPPGWRVESVLKIVRNPLYRRRQRFGGETRPAEASVPASVPEDLWRRADALLLARFGQAEKTTHSGHAGRADYYLSGLLRCARCGYAATLGHNAARLRPDGSPGRPVLYFHCTGRAAYHHCALPSLAARRLDALLGPALRDALARRLADVLGQSPAPPRRAARPGKPGSAQAEAARTEAARARVLEMYVDGEITREQKDQHLARLAARGTSPPAAPAPAALLDAATCRELLAALGRAALGEDAWAEGGLVSAAKREFLTGALGLGRHGLAVDAFASAEAGRHFSPAGSGPRARPVAVQVALTLPSLGPDALVLREPFAPDE